MKFAILPIDVLQPNCWNSNKLSREAEVKLEKSISRHDGLFKPILAREIENDRLEIIGGEHRWEAAKRLGHTEIPVINLGPLSDVKAKEIGILDNGRYGQDDATLLSDILSELGDLTELTLFMPFDIDDLDKIMATRTIDLDSLDLAEEDAPEVENIPSPPRIPKTHAVMRFKTPLADTNMVEKAIKRVISDQQLEDSDSLVNAGDALIWIISRWIELEGQNENV